MMTKEKMAEVGEFMDSYVGTLPEGTAYLVILAVEGDLRNVEVVTNTPHNQRLADVVAHGRQTFFEMQQVEKGN